jgi:hypothetical protein
LVKPGGFAGLRPHRGSIAGRASHPAPAAALRTAFLRAEQFLFRRRFVGRMGRRFRQGPVEQGLQCGFPHDEGGKCVYEEPPPGTFVHSKSPET